MNPLALLAGLLCLTLACSSHRSQPPLQLTVEGAHYRFSLPDQPLAHFRDCGNGLLTLPAATQLLDTRWPGHPGVTLQALPFLCWVVEGEAMFPAYAADLQSCGATDVAEISFGRSLLHEFAAALPEFKAQLNQGRLYGHVVPQGSLALLIRPRRGKPFMILTPLLQDRPREAAQIFVRSLTREN